MSGHRTIVRLTAALALLAMSAAAWADVTMGVFPRRPVGVTHKAFKPLAAHLSQVLGEKVTLVVPKDFKAFWAGVKAGRFDLVHYNQYHYLKSHKELGYRVIVANEERGKRTIAGALSVRKDSGIESVADLKGKTILFGGGRMAMGSYIAPTAVLKRAGLVEGRDYTARFAKNPPAAVIAVYNKAADAAGSGNVVLQLGVVKSRIDVGQMKVLAESEPFTHLCWAVAPSVPEAKAKKIQQAMVSLKQTAPAVLKAAKVTDFYAVTDKDFDKVREIVRFALGESY